MLSALVVVAALAFSAGARAAPMPAPSRPPVTTLGTLVQLPGPSGCLVDSSARGAGCLAVSALHGAGPFLGSEAIAVSPDGRNVYVASSTSNAIAVFTRNASTGQLTQGSGAAGCIAAQGAGGCANATGLEGPNSVAVSSDGRNVYATSVNSNAVDTFSRDPSTGALTQVSDGTGDGCIANVPTSGCETGRALDGPDVVVVSADGLSVYVGAFNGSSIAVFDRNAATGVLTQPADPSGCIVDSPVANCTTGLALGAPEGMAISPDGNDVYVAAALSGALDSFARDPSTGALTQIAGGSGCIVQSPLVGCTTGVELGGADAVAVSPDGSDVYVTSALSNSVTAFTRSATSGQLVQQSGTSACVVYVLAVGCSLGQKLNVPEGLAVSPDGANVYVTAFSSGAVDVLNRNATTGALTQKPRRPGCLAAGVPQTCTTGRALRGVSSIAVSPNGRSVYSVAFASNAVGIFDRVTKAVTKTASGSGGRG